jgi:hypothetical protein
MLEASSEVVVRRRLQPGTQVGKHLVIRSVLGTGGTAVVYEALHTRLNSSVALKVAHVSANADDEAPARLEREARVCAAIEDPRVPRVYDLGELDDGRPYLVMQKVSGQTLEEVMAQGCLTARAVLRIAREVLSALDAVHANGVVHRDVKPSNVIARFEENGFPRVHLMDFGVSKETSSRPSEPALTRPGAIVGTPLYMAPEQMAGDPVDARADLYAVGVLLYEMLSGRAPFVGCSTAEIMAAVLRRDHPTLDQVWPEAPKPLVELVSRAMAERARDRFASAREMREAIDAVMYAVDAMSVRTSMPPAPSTLLPRAGWGVLSVAIACAVMVGSSAPKVGSDATWLGPLASAALLQSAAAAESARAPAPSVLAPELPVAVQTVEHKLETQPALAARPRLAPTRAAMVHAKAPARMATPVRGKAAASNASVLLARSLRELDALRNGLDVPTASGVNAAANAEHLVTD